MQTLQALGRTAAAGSALRELFATRKSSALRAREELKQWQEKHKDSKPETLSEAERHELRRLRSLAGTNPFAVELLMAGQSLAEGDAPAALQHLAKAEKMSATDAELHVRKGSAYLTLKDWAAAEASFRRALKIDATSAAAHLGLCRSCLGTRRNAEALAAALDTIGLGYLNPHAHFCLGVAMHRLGRPLQAVEALKVALMQNPNYVPALTRIATIVENRLKDPVMAATYRRQAGEARQRIKDVTAGTQPQPAARAVRRTATASGDSVLEQDLDQPRQIAGPLADTITIVSGLPRAGTSMMMQMLSAGGVTALVDGHRPADANNEKGYFEDVRARGLQRDAAWLPEARGKAVKIVAQLLGSLPADPANSYGVVFMLRDLNEVVASQRDLLAAQGKASARMPDTLLKQTFITQMQRIRKILAIRKIPVLYVEHRDCLQAPAAVAARVNAFLGGGLDAAAMAGAVAPALYRHVRPG